MPLKSVIPYSAITSNSDFGLSVDFWMISGEFADRIKCINQNDTTEDFHRYCRMVKSGIWYAIFYKETAMICSLPVKIKKDKEGRLHSISEAAVKWKDNQNDYFIHGVNFDRLLWGKITKREIKIKEILQIQNIEQRYAAIQTYGYDTMINEIDAMMIDKSKRGNELYVIRDSLIEGRSLKLLKYSCPSTDRIYHSFVPDDMYNADHAMAWKFNLSLDEYSKLEIET
jgi:hypothetical protein